MQVIIKYPIHITDRLATLRKFKALTSEFGRSKLSRARAYRGYKEILKQINDRHLMELRRRLLLAVKSRNERAEWKIGNQIKAYLGDQLLVNPNWHK